MPKETKYSRLMQQIYDHGKEIFLIRKEKKVLSDVDIETDVLGCAIRCLEGEVGEGLDVLGFKQLDRVMDYYYYKGYWKALLWVMDMSHKRDVCIDNSTYNT